MTIGIVGRKSGMTRIFTEDGLSIPVTVIEVEPNRITQVKNAETDGYQAVQVAIGSRRASRVSQAQKGHFEKAGSEAAELLVELRNEAGEAFEVGAQISVTAFEAGQKVDITGQSKGKGYAGAIKRWNFRAQDTTHGNSLSHRAPGSIGQCQTPGRVWKGKKMSGHMGNERVTTQNLEIVRVDAERNLLLIKGSVPGAPGGSVIVRPAVKVRKDA
jgi:large subunit ribosomal protein L3